MAGWLDDIFNGAQFKGQDPKGLLEMLSQLAQTQAGPSAGFPPAGPPQMSAAGGGPMMPLPRGPAPDLPPPKDIAALPQPPANLPVNPNFPPDAQASAEPPTGAVVPAAAMAPPPGAAPFFPGQDVLGRLGRHVLQTLHDNSNSMIAGGGAMISGGLGHGLSAMAAAAPLDIAARRERQGNEAIQATYNAVLQQQLGRGVPIADARANALAASQNKDILKDFLGPQYQHATVTDAFGNQKIVMIDPRTGRQFDAAGGGGSGGFDMSNIDSSKMGDEYLAQYPKEAQARILDYYNNRVSGSQPKGKVEPMLKYAAEKYAQDKGHPIDDISVAERRKMMLDIEDNKFSSIGGSKTNANASLKHLAASSDQAVRMDTMGNIAGVPALAHGYNIVRNQFGDKSAIAQGLFDTNYTFGGEKTKFLTGAQGTHDERLQYTKLLGPEKTPLEKAEVYAAERKLLVDKLVSNQDKIERSIPASERAKAPEKFRMFEPETVKLIEKLDRNIAILRGEAKAGPEPVRVQSVAEARKLPKGTPIILPDGSPGVVP